MESNRESSSRHWIPLLTSVLVKHLWVVPIVGLGVAYYLRATVGYDRFFEAMFTTNEGLGVLAAIPISVIIVKPSADLFYGAELAAQARKQAVRGFSFPDSSLYYPTMISNIGTLRKCAGYIYAIAHTVIFLALGVALGMLALSKR